MATALSPCRRSPITSRPSFKITSYPKLLTTLLRNHTISTRTVSTPSPDFFLLLLKSSPPLETLDLLPLRIPSLELSSSELSRSITAISESSVCLV
ncbi:hypothetical protein Hanom_Chr02g00172871 [Helianthus anomalus]